MADKDDLSIPWLRSKANIALLAFLGIIGYFLITEHWAHVIQALPYALVVGCVVMHLFMHGGSHSHGGHKLGDIYHIRFQFHQAPYCPRLAFVRRIFRFSDRLVHRNVWFSVDHLSAFGMVD